MALRCSFCNKAQAEVHKLIAGPTVFICDECVQVCAEIIANEMEPIPTTGQPPPVPTSSDTTRIVTCALCGLQLPWADALLVSARGFLCIGCTGEIEACLAEAREQARDQ
jgi:hypothetical protein